MYTNADRDVAGVTDITDVADVTDIKDVADVTDIMDVAGVTDVTDITGGTVRHMALIAFESVWSHQPIRSRPPRRLFPFLLHFNRHKAHLKTYRQKTSKFNSVEN